jgi:hypothetical protein
LRKFGRDDVEISLLDDRDRRPEAPRTRIARFCMPTLDEGDRPGQPPIQLVRLQALAQKVELDLGAFDRVLGAESAAV